MEKSFINTLSTEEHKLLDIILINCAVKISKTVDQHQNPKAYAKFLENVIDKKRNLVGMKLFAELPNINTEELYTQAAIKKLISIDNISDSTFSKVYGEFVKRKLLKNYTDKKELHDFRTHEFLTSGKKSNYKTAGRISFYQKEPIIDKARELLSKPGVIEDIIDTLNKYDNSLIDKFLELNFASLFYLIQHRGNEMEVLIKSMHNYDKNKQVDLNTYDKGKNFCLSLSEQEIEGIVKISVKAIKKEPFFWHSIIYILGIIGKLFVNFNSFEMPLIYKSLNHLFKLFLFVN